MQLRDSVLKKKTNATIKSQPLPGPLVTTESFDWTDAFERSTTMGRESGQAVESYDHRTISI